MEKITDGGVDVADHHKPQRQFGFTGKQIHRNKIQDKNKDTVSDRLQQRSGYRLLGMMGLMGKYLHGNVCLWIRFYTKYQIPVSTTHHPDEFHPVDERPSRWSLQ